MVEEGPKVSEEHKEIPAVESGGDKLLPDTAESQEVDIDEAREDRSRNRASRAQDILKRSAVKSAKFLAAAAAGEVKADAAQITAARAVLQESGIKGQVEQIGDISELEAQSDEYLKAALGELMWKDKTRPVIAKVYIKPCLEPDMTEIDQVVEAFENAKKQGYKRMVLEFYTGKIEAVAS